MTLGPEEHLTRAVTIPVDAVVEVISIALETIHVTVIIFLLIFGVEILKSNQYEFYF